MGRLGLHEESRKKDNIDMPVMNGEEERVIRMNEISLRPLRFRIHHAGSPW
jgi:hypothetical protein